ncbi:MAG: hypothetical protein KF802_02310 [Bdellovibrionaceae bacterium]|nr:hypothetical protein [Pseudobdellovibrionaceae bacterium]
MQNKTIVVIESPYEGKTTRETKQNVEYAQKCLADCLKRGEAPFSSSLTYKQANVLDSSPESQQLCENAGDQFLSVASKVVVYIDKGISPEMDKGIAKAKTAGITVELRSLKIQVGA